MVDTRIGGVYATFRAENNPFLRASRQNIAALRKQSRSVKELRKNSRELRRTSERLVRTLSTVGKRLAQAATIGLGFAIRSYANLEQTLASVRGITGATENQFEFLSKQVRRLGRTTRFTAQQAAEGQLFLARAGFKVREIYAALPGTLKLAQAATVELGEAADIVSNVLSSFRAGADETERFGDVLSRTTISANTNLIQLADAIKLVGPISTSLGVTLETTAASIGILSNAGLQATLAGTGLRRILFNLEAPTTAITAILRDLELQVDDVSISQNGLIVVIERLRDAGISAAQAIELFGARGAPAFNVLVSSIPQLKELEAVLKSSAGTTTELARIQDDTLVGSFFRLVSAADGFGESLVRVSGLGTSLRSLFDTLADSINKLTDFVAKNIQSVLRQARFAAELLFAVFLINGPLGRSIVNLAVIAKSVGGLTFAIGLAAKAARLLGRALFVGFLVEGIYIAIDATQALRLRFESLANVADFISIAFLEAFSNIVNLTGRVADAVRNAFSLGSSDTATIPVNFVDVYYSPERQAELREAARRGGETYIETFIALVRERYERFIKGDKGGVALPALPALPSPKDIPFVPGSTAEIQSRDVTRRATAALNQQIPITTRLTRSLQDRVRAAEGELELIQAAVGETDRRRIQSEIIAQFENERIGLLRQQEDIELRLGGLRGSLTEAQELGLSAVTSELERQIRIEKEKLDLIIAQSAASNSLRADLISQSAVYADILENIGEQTQAVNRLSEIYDAVGNAFATFASTVITDFKSIGDAARSLGQTILNDLIRVLIVAEIRAAALGFLGSLGGGGGGGGSAASSVGSIFGAQSGGVHSGFGLVGEGGPELVDFRRPGRVYTNEELGAALGAGSGPATFNFSPIIQSSDGPAVRRAVAEAFPIFEERVLGRFAGDMRRPSALRTVTRR